MNFFFSVFLKEISKGQVQIMIEIQEICDYQVNTRMQNHDGT